MFLMLLLYFKCTVLSCFSTHIGSKGFWSGKQTVWISKTPYYTCYQDGSHKQQSDY